MRIPLSQNSSNALDVESLSVKFESTTVLENISLQIAPGEFVALMGPSGAGKSTLLRAIMNEVPYFKGAIRGPKRIAFAPQRSPLLPWLTVMENVELAKPESETAESFRHRAQNILARTGLADHLLLKGHQLSGGMRSRTSLVRAFLMLDSELKNQVALLDEPFMGLDILKRDQLHALTKELWLNQKPATVFVTHDPNEAIQLANRILVLSAAGDRFNLDVVRQGSTWKNPEALLREIYEALK